MTTEPEPEKTEPEAEKTELPPTDSLVPLDKYLAAGVHIGTQRKLKDMEQFIYKVRPDGLSVLDVGVIDKKMEAAANFLAKYNPEKILVVCARDVGKKPVQKFAELVGASAITTRYMPGSMTNPSYGKYREPDVLLVVDPGADKQAVKEALDINIPIVALCDTNNMTQNLDLIIPVNNKGKKSLALVFWLLAREVMKAQGKIKKDQDYKLETKDFEEE
jgi:small subunit ribosomal protein S2